jgi:serine/threonine-protein kinase HipA
VTVASVELWGRRVGAVQIEDGYAAAVFQYDPEFARSGIQVAPLTMPLREQPYEFTGLGEVAFHGLPGLLADSLPDRFGTALIEAWLARQGTSMRDFNSVDRLCYVGRRAMGALEFKPVIGPRSSRSKAIDVNALVELASAILTRRGKFSASFADDDLTRSVADILLVGTSAGGARAKAVVAYNPETKEVRSGQVDVDPGFEHWILKFDGVSGNDDKDLHQPLGYGAIEFAYSEMARAAGIDMTACRILEEGERRHFMTRRFDRDSHGDKRHMQSLGALRHYDYMQSGAHSYEEAFDTCRRLDLSMHDLEQMYRRMVFNILACNNDDHVKNIAFLMGRDGGWSLTPAFDVTYAFRPDGPWTSRHQMTVNEKQSGFSRKDLEECAQVAGLRRGRGTELLAEVGEAISGWRGFASEAKVGARDVERIAAAHDHCSLL